MLANRLMPGPSLEANPGTAPFPRKKGFKLAIYPCQQCHNPFKGEARNVYLSVFNGESSVKLRYVVCPDCQDLLIDPWMPHALYRDADGEWCLMEATTSLDDLWSTQEAPQRPFSRRKVS